MREFEGRDDAWIILFRPFRDVDLSASYLSFFVGIVSLFVCLSDISNIRTIYVCVGWCVLEHKTAKEGRWERWIVRHRKMETKKDEEDRENGNRKYYRDGRFFFLFRDLNCFRSFTTEHIESEKKRDLDFSRFDLFEKERQIRDAGTQMYWIRWRMFRTHFLRE